MRFSVGYSDRYYTQQYEKKSVFFAQVLDFLTGALKKRGGMPESGGSFVDIWGIFGGYLQDMWRKIARTLGEIRMELGRKRLTFKILIKKKNPSLF